MKKTFPRFFISTAILLSPFLQPSHSFASELSEQRQSYMRQYVENCCHENEDASFFDFEVLFFDLNGDGNEEALIADKYNRDRSGNGWSPTHRNKLTGGIESHPVSTEGGLLISSYPWNLYVVSQHTGRAFLCGQHVCVYDIKPGGLVNGRQEIYMADVILKMDTDGFLRKETLNNGLVGIVSDSSFERIDRAVTEFYKGKNAALSSRGAEAKDISLPKPDGMERFVRSYRDEVRRILQVERKITVFLIFFDADSDGDLDFYASSDAEARAGESYVWHLFRNNNGTYDRETSIVWFNANKDFNRESIHPEEIARKDSFYQVQRMHGFSPSVVILDRNGTGLHSRAFLRQKTSDPPGRPARQLTYEQRREYYPAMEEWYAHEKSKLGYIPAYDFEELISRPEFLRLERLKSVEFPEQ